MAGEGRPTDCTPAVTARMVEALSKGQFVRAACRYAGIASSSHYDWCKRADDGEGPPFSDYASAVRAADVEGEQRHLANIEDAATGSAGKPGDWRASAWVLERRHPDDYGKQRLEVSGPEGGPVQVDLRTKIAEVLAERTDDQAGVPDDL